MLLFAKSLVEIGESDEPSCNIDVQRVLAHGNTVRKGIIELCSAMPVDLAKDIGKSFKYGSGITSDRVKLDLTVKKYCLCVTLS